MKGVRFYLEYKTPAHKRKDEHIGTVIAVYGQPHYGMCDAIGALFDEPNSVVWGTTAHVDYIRTQCKRVSETKAREIHPRLFAYLKLASTA